MIVQAQPKHLRGLEAEFHALRAWDVFEGVLALLRLHDADEHPQVFQPIVECIEHYLAGDCSLTDLDEVSLQLSHVTKALVPLDHAPIHTPTGAARAHACEHGELPLEALL